MLIPPAQLPMGRQGMQIPIVSHLRKAALKREFLRKNADISQVFGRKQPALRLVSDNSAPLSPADVEHWEARGFLILRGFFPQAAVEEYKRHVDELWQERHRPENPLVMFTARGKIYFRDALDGDRSHCYRLADHYMTDPPTRDLAMDPRLTRILHQLMGYAPVVCNTILFERGSEQDMHSDMFYMPPVTENQMVATWIAIDDVTDDNGPLVYVPGSHKLPSHRFSNGSVRAIPEEVPAAVAAIQKRMSDLGLASETFTAKRGDVLIWHSQLMHGGNAIRDRSAKRTSIVTHYLSTCDVPMGDWLCAKRTDGSLLLVKKHLPVAAHESSRPPEQA